MEFVNSPVLWPTVQQEWPLRLLDVRSMTSIERVGESTYGQDEAPNYSVLSYTWGRFETRNGCHLSISGVKWPIPAIEDSHFTVAQFERVLQRMKSSYDWDLNPFLTDYVWLDIACINQDRSEESEAEKMHQVGRQAGIFRRAREAYIWLNRLEPDQLSACVRDVIEFTYRMAKKECHLEEAVQVLTRSLAVLVQDPWFSSLWTLQESVLKKNAFILDKNGDCIMAPGPWAGIDTRVRLMDISGACELAVALLEPRKSRVSDGVESNHQSQKCEGWFGLHKLIVESGVGFGLSMNPNIQYAAARFRQTKYEEDRIYAIMQVYGFRLGKAVNPKKAYTVAQLELQFLTAICQVPVLAEAFVHLKDSAKGQSWAITPHVTIPRRLYKILASRHHLSNACKIRISHRSCASFDGMVCKLRDLKNYWVAYGEETISIALAQHGDPAHTAKNPNGSVLATGSRLSFFLDHNHAALGKAAGMSYEWPLCTEDVDDNGEVLTETSPDELSRSLETMRESFDTISSTFGDDNVHVLYLGRSTYASTIDLGVVLIRQKSGSLSRYIRRDIWIRVGICIWPASGGSKLLPGFQDPVMTNAMWQAEALGSKTKTIQTNGLTWHALKGTFG